MAVGIPVAGTTSSGSVGPVSPTLPASVAANDILVLAACPHAAGTTSPPTAITWPSLFVQGGLLALKDATGAQTGCFGWAWARAAGGETGTRSISYNGTGDSCTSQAFKIPGAVTSGDPWEDLQSNNPNYTTAVTWPSATMTLSSGGLSFLLWGVADNLTSTVPAGWTSSSANGTTTGSDTEVDSRYRQPGATGTYSPAGFTLSAPGAGSGAYGWANFHIMFTDTAGAAPADVLPERITARWVPDRRN